MTQPSVAPERTTRVWRRNELLNALSWAHEQATELHPDNVVHWRGGSCQATSWLLATETGLDALCHPEPHVDYGLLLGYASHKAAFDAAVTSGDEDAVAAARATVFVLEALMMARLGHQEHLDILSMVGPGCECGHDCGVYCGDCGCDCGACRPICLECQEAAEVAQTAELDGEPELHVVQEG